MRSKLNIRQRRTLLLPFYFGLALLLAPSITAAAPRAYRLDPRLSTVRFQFSGGLGNYTGRFTRYSGSLQTKEDAGQATVSEVKVHVDISAVDVDPQINVQTLSPEILLQAVPNTQFRFQSLELKAIGRNRYQVAGKLVQGKNQWPVSFPAIIIAHGAGRFEIRAKFNTTPPTNEREQLLSIQTGVHDGTIDCRLVFTAS